MFSDKRTADLDAGPTTGERREWLQPPNRQSGTVISISGSRAILATKFPTLLKPDDPYWAIGNLVTIYGPRSRIICLVQDMAIAASQWSLGEENDARANVEMLGEIMDDDVGKPEFRRGITNYPPLGAPVHRIRSDDLIAMYDLKERKPSVIGSLVMDNKMPAAINIEGMLKKHFAVVGTTGVGKSTSVSILLRAAVADRSKLRVIILDPHNEYTSVFKDGAVTVDARSFELPFWLFKFEEMVEVVFRGAKPDNDEIDFLRDAIVIAKEMYDTNAVVQQGSILKKTLRADGTTVTADAPQPYRMVDLIALIDDALGKLEQKFDKSALKTLKARLESICNDSSYKFMFGTAALDGAPEQVIRQLFRLHEPQRRITILQLAGIPSDVVNASVSVLARMAFDLSVAARGAHEILVLCEEAHRYVPALSDAFSPTRRSIARIAKEGRKYGCYLGIVTQRPSELDPTILSQCSTMFAMRLANAEDQNIIRSAIPDAATGVLDFISALSNREAIAFGEAVATPMRMMFTRLLPDQLPKMTEDTLDDFNSAGERGSLFAVSEPRVPPPAALNPAAADAYGAPKWSDTPAHYGQSLGRGNAPPQRQEIRELLRRTPPLGSAGQTAAPASTDAWPSSSGPGGFGKR